LKKAQRVFRIAKDYGYLKFLENLIKTQKNPILQKAEVYLFLGQIEKLEEHLVVNNRQDLLVSMLFRTKQWKACFQHMNYMDVAQKEHVVKRCVELYLKQHDESTLRELFSKMNDPNLQLDIARQLRDPGMLSKLKSNLKVEHFQKQISEAFGDLGMSKEMGKDNALEKQSPNNGQEFMFQKQMSKIEKCLVKIISSYLSPNPKSIYPDPIKTKMVLIYIGLFKLKNTFTFPPKFKQNLTNKLTSKLSFSPKAQFQSLKLTDKILEDPFLLAFPVHIFDCALKALKSKDFKRAFHLSSLLKPHNLLIPQEQLSLLWSLVTCSLENYEDSVSELLKLKEYSLKNEDWDAVNKYNQIIMEHRQMNVNVKNRNSLLKRKCFEGVSVREICLSSGEVVGEKDAVICKTCHFKTLQEEILKKKLAYCGLCRMAFN
jgi:hypothetical protein